MRKLATFIAIAAGSLLVGVLAPNGAEAGSVVIRRAVASAGGAPAAPAFEIVGSTASGASVVSATATITTTANTTKVFALWAFRRNASQSTIGCTFNGVAMTDSEATATAASGHRTMIWYLNNPGAVTNGNLVCTLSATSPGLGLSGIAVTGATVIKSTGVTNGSVTTSSATIASGLAVGDIMIDLMAKQDPTTANPTLNTVGAILKIDYTYSTTGNGAFYKSAIFTATGASQTINFSWAGAANTAHCWLAVSP